MHHGRKGLMDASLGENQCLEPMGDGTRSPVTREGDVAHELAAGTGTNPAVAPYRGVGLGCILDQDGSINLWDSPNATLSWRGRLQSQQQRQT